MNREGVQRTGRVKRDEEEFRKNRECNKNMNNVKKHRDAVR